MRAVLAAAMFAMALAEPAGAQELVAARNLRPGMIVAQGDLVAAGTSGAGAVDEAVGLEVRRTVYAGRALRAGDLGSPRVVARNEVVSLVFLSGGLGLRTEGRALDAGAVGERIRVMNLTSRQIISAVVRDAGLVEAMR